MVAMDGQQTTAMMLQTVDSEDHGAAKQLTSQVIQQADQLLQPQPVQSEESSLESSGGGSPQRAEPPGRFLSAFSSPDDSQTFFSRVTSASSSGYSPQQSPLQSSLHFSPVSTPSRGENLLPITPGSYYSTDTSSLRSSSLPTTPNRPVSGAQQQQLPLSYRTFVSMTKTGETSVASPSKSGASPSISPKTRAARIAEATKFAKRHGDRRQQLPSATLQPKSSVVAKEQAGQNDQEDEHENLQKELQAQFEQEHENEQRDLQEHLEFREHIQAQFEQEQEQQEQMHQDDERQQEQTQPDEQQQQEQTQQDEQQQEDVHMQLNESYHEEPVQQQEEVAVKQQVQQEQNQTAQPQNHVQLPPHPNRASLPRAPSVDPPEVSNQVPAASASSSTARTKMRRSKRSKDKSKSGSDVESDWSSDAIESVSSSVNMALDKLKAIAKPYMGQSADNDDAPEVVNTSTEDTASSSSGPDCTGLDLKELERELRAKKPDEIEEHGQTAEAKKDNDAEQPQRQVNRHTSNSSFDTLGMPKPAVLNHDPSLLWNLQKPVPRSGGPPLVRSHGASNPREVAGLVLPTSHANDKLNPSKGSEVGSNLSGSNGSSTNSMKISRAVTPIMRMRGTGGEQEFTAVEASPGRDDNEEDHKALKQKQWKEKMKLVERQREREKKLLSGEAAPRRRKKRSKSRKAQRDDGSASTRSQKPFVSAFPVCQSEITSMLVKFVGVRCGNLEDAFFEDDDEDSDNSTDGSEYETEDDGTEMSADYTDNTDPEESIALPKSSVDASTMTSAISKTSVTTGTMTSATKTTASKDIDTAAATATSSNPVVPFEENANDKSAVGIKDKNFIRAFISGATKNGFVLMLHEKNRKKSLNRPTKTIAFVKRGAPAKSGRFVGPTLVWKSIGGTEIGEVDLFDIKSLDKASALQLEDYPLAMPGRSLFLRMNKGADYVFEAKNEDEALRFVHGMRWVIARLSFNLIIGNLSVSCELLDVERSGDDENGKFPRTLIEESHWTMAMTDVTSHLVDKAAIL